MQDLKELYQEVILDHNKNPRNCACMERATSQAHGHNPLCGDKLMVYLKLADNIIEDVSFEGRGCAISQASASIMTEVVKGMNVADARSIFHQVHELLTNDAFDAKTISNLKLQVLAGVRAYPARVKCASLAWHTLIAAMNQDSHEAKTE